RDPESRQVHRSVGRGGRVPHVHVEVHLLELGQPVERVGAPRGGRRASGDLSGRLGLFPSDRVRREPHPGSLQGLQQARADGADPEARTAPFGPPFDRLGEHLVRRYDLQTNGRPPQGPPLRVLHVPREVTTENIARSLGVSRSTYEEHLRKAENRIVGNLIPYLQLFAVGEKKPEKMLLKETPLEPTIET